MPSALNFESSMTKLYQAFNTDSPPFTLLQRVIAIYLIR